jgi:hypothetical protein
VYGAPFCVKNMLLASAEQRQHVASIGTISMHNKTISGLRLRIMTPTILDLFLDESVATICHRLIVQLSQICRKKPCMRSALPSAYMAF